MLPAKAAARRRSNAKPKNSATVTPKPAANVQAPPIRQTGGKVPPKANPAAAKNKIVQTGKDPPKIVRTVKSANAKAEANKKKSIFSPENSTESEDDTVPTSRNIKSSSNKTSAVAAAVLKAKPKATAKPVEKQQWSSTTQKQQQQQQATKQSKQQQSEQTQVKAKQPPVVETSASSAASSSAASTSSSDSDSSHDSGVSNKKAAATVTRRNSSKKMSPKPCNSDSENEEKGTGKNKSQVTRMSTRTANSRKSKLVQPPASNNKHNSSGAGANLSTSGGGAGAGTSSSTQHYNTDTDSDTEGSKRRSMSRSPVKRAPTVVGGVITGKVKQRGNDAAKVRGGVEIKQEIEVLEERKCPLDGCNSEGHLGGRLEHHFTIDACPLFHNVSANECAELYQERKRREEVRKRAIDSGRKSPRAVLATGGLGVGVGQNNNATAEQRAYLQRIRDMRLKWKAEQQLIDEAQENKKHHHQPPQILDKNRQPDLSNNFVPAYDLKLFQDAQALASERIENDLQTQPNTKGTKYIEMGRFEMEVWYQSPYPEEYARLPKLYICEYCLRYMRGRTVLRRHAAKCVWRHPPGEEVYRKEKISVWEVDGKRYKQYCQNLCLLAKFFLDHKTLYYDVEPFLFYVMTMLDNEGCHTVGYFSKEKNSFLNYNVSCILTLPPYQRQGYGRLLIDFSYLLTRVEGKIGSPEKPLSDLGLISYRSYWKDVLLGYLCSRPGTQLSVKDISQEMAIHSYDIVSTLQALGMMKYWKGKHIILKKPDVLDDYMERVKRRGVLLKEVDPSCLRWTPFVPPQANPS